jgi:hypothetical protein
MFRRNISPPSSWLNKPSKIPMRKQVAGQVIGWLEILDYIGSKREMEERNSVSTGLLWGRMKLLGSHMTTVRTNRRQQQEFRMALKRDSIAGLGKRCTSMLVCWAGN